MTTIKILEATDFMMMDVHRPMTDEEINAINPQARVDRSAWALKIVDSEAESVGPPQSTRCDRCFGPIPCDKHPEEKLYAGPFVNFPENVTVADVATSHELEVNRVLQSAYDNKLSQVLVLGYREDGEFWILASDPDIAEVNLLCDLAKTYFMQVLNNRTATEDPRGPKEWA